jgi:hypothetical protein
LSEAEVERRFTICYGRPKPHDMTYEEAAGYLYLDTNCVSYACVLLSVTRSSFPNSWKPRLLTWWTLRAREDAKDFLRAALRELHSSRTCPFVKAAERWCNAGRPKLSSMSLFGTWSGKYAALLNRDTMTMADWPDGVSDWCVTAQRKHSLDVTNSFAN